MRTIECGKCTGGRVKEPGFDGATMVDCGECRGAGVIPLTAEEAAILGRFLDECQVALECDVCGQPRDRHDDGECPPVIPFLSTAAPPAA